MGLNPNSGPFGGLKFGSMSTNHLEGVPYYTPHSQIKVVATRPPVAATSPPFPPPGHPPPGLHVADQRSARQLRRGLGHEGHTHLTQRTFRLNLGKGKN